MKYQFVIKFQDCFYVKGALKNDTMCIIPYRSMEAFKLEIPFRIGQRESNGTILRSTVGSIEVMEVNSSITEELKTLIKSVNMGADFQVRSIDFIPCIEPDPVQINPIHYMFGRH